MQFLVVVYFRKATILTDKFFSSCPAHPNPLIRSIGNYTLVDLHRLYRVIEKDGRDVKLL